MLRTILAAAITFASCASAMAQELPADEAMEQAGQMTPEVRREGFVLSGDECGASRYSHLLGENYAELYDAALVPDDSAVVNQATMRTLEYRPGQLNIVVNGQGRVIAVGCF